MKNTGLMKKQNILIIFYQNNYLVLFRKGISSHHYLQVLIEKWKKIRDKGVSFGALLTDCGLSKAFGYLLHDLLIAYAFDMPSLVNSHLSSRKQRVKIIDKFSSREEIISGVLRGLPRTVTFFNFTMYSYLLMTLIL